MNLQIKTLLAVANGNYVIAIVRGSVGIVGVRVLLDKLIEATQSVLDGKVLVDLQDAMFQLPASDFGQFIDKFDFTQWPHNNKVALISVAKGEQFQQLATLSESLAKQSLKIRVFYDSKEALNWLSDMP
jgi:hypothetical protein